jgi:hypothetical protein
MTHRLLLAVCAALALSTPALADDSGAFLVRLGDDTTSVESYTRSPAKLEVQQVGRSPRVLRRRFVYDLDRNGNVTQLSMVVTPPDNDTPTQTVTGTLGGPDSARFTIESAGRPATHVNVKLPADAVIVASTSPWTGYEGAFQKLVKSRRDSLRTTIYFIGGDTGYWLTLQRLGTDSIAVANGHLDQFHARIDRSGRILGVLPVAGTGKFSVRRMDRLDVAAYATAFAAREKAGVGLGMLSPRDSVKTTVAGASISVDYGRPARRGRVVYGGVVPYGEVWRTGANAATQFRTDRALDFNGVRIPAGFYTLWTLPTAQGWKLIVNSETGQWGTEHHADRDIATIDMTVDTLPQPQERFTIRIDAAADGGVIRLDWDTTRASAAFKVVP